MTEAMRKTASTARRAAAEGIVMLENKNGALPLKRREKVAIFGRAQIDYNAGGTGSGGSVNTEYQTDILSADLLAMSRAFEGLCISPKIVLVDGDVLPELNDPMNADVKYGGELKNVIGGDAKSEAIAAASILAKVTRDREMAELALKYPQYGFEKHKGYGTKAHYESIEKYGLCPIHRKSFLKKYLNNKNE